MGGVNTARLASYRVGITQLFQKKKKRGDNNNGGMARMLGKKELLQEEHNRANSGQYKLCWGNLGKIEID